MLLSLSHPSLYPSSKPTNPPSPQPSPKPSLHYKTPKPPKRLRSAPGPDPDQTLAPKSSIQTIADKLRSLGFLESDPTTTTTPAGPGTAGEIFIPTPHELPNRRVGHTIDSSWSSPENPIPVPGSGPAIAWLHELWRAEERKEKEPRAARVPTVAELTIPAEELKRLREVGIGLDKKLKVGKAGITEGIVNGIHERWRRSELVKIKCEDLCRMNMKRTHEMLERKTGGLVVWRSGSIIILYRGANYKFPYFNDGDQMNSNVDKISLDPSPNDGTSREGEENTITAVAGNPYAPSFTSSVCSSLIVGVGSPKKVRLQLPGEVQLEEEADRLLDGLGPRFTDWWGYDPLPVDADLLPSIVPGFRKPFRLLPSGIKPKLTDREMTILRRLSRPLPCHFALGKNKNLQGLAVSMIKLWEKCEVAKIAVKRGAQNTNPGMMVEELKRLTGGTLLSKDKEFIVFYRGKDFLPTAVSSAIEERRCSGISNRRQSTYDESPKANTAASIPTATKPPINELQEATEQKKSLATERRLIPTNLAIHSMETKLSQALAKKEHAEKLLAELEKSVEPPITETDKEGISEEERYMLRKVGLRMKPFLLLGRRGVFAGTVENMHLHWKYRELVKIISKDWNINHVESAARSLEAESGGILVAVERVNKGYAIIVYRGKNYRRPAELRPRTLMNKKEALKRSLEAQRCESLKLHILGLSKNIGRMEHQMARDYSVVNLLQSTECERLNTTNEMDQSGFPKRDGSAGFAHLEENIEAGDYSEEDLMQSTECERSITANRMDLSGTTRRGSNTPESAHLQENIEEVNEADKEILHSNEHNHILTDREEIADESTITMKSTLQMDFIQNKVSHASYTPTNSRDIHDSEAEYTSDKPVIHPEASLYTTSYTSQLPGDELMGLTFEATRSKSESHEDELKGQSDVKIPFRAAPLSNRERLVLRKQALKMKKRPVLAVGRNNVVTGVAKTIKTHFRKYPLAIVNIKGRAEGTSAQEVIFELEQATGAVLVSREPNKVILYRGWGEGESPREGSGREKKVRKGSKDTIKEESVSPKLMEAIRHECGLPNSQVE